MPFANLVPRFFSFVEVNLETNGDARKIFEKDLNIERIVRQLSNS